MLNLAYFRLFYLYQGQQTGWIKEENLMHILYWLSPILGVVFSTSHIVENVMHEYEYLFHVSYCRKTSFAPGIIRNLFFANSCMLLTTMSIVGEFAAHICIFVKKTCTESRARVYEMRGNRLVCEQRRQRNVVSALGHCVSFAVGMAQRVIFAVALYAIEEDAIVTLARMLMFLLPCINFFVHPLVETLSTHNLRQSLFTA